MPDRPARFNQRSADQIIDATMRVENQFYTPQQQVQFGGRVWQGPIECVVTTAITAASGTTYGSGAVQPYLPTYNSNSGVYTATPDDSFATFNSNTNTWNTNVTCLNWSQNSNTIANGTHGYAVWRGGWFEWLVGDC